jgi:hypothetical protein
VILTLSGAGWVLRAEWDRARCAYLVFEVTHSKLVGAPAPATPAPVSVTDQGDSVVGHGVCGQSTETVRLPKLEATS